ncbi:hypothetical protein F2Q70_00010933 [Brassica cretica]|uniref:Uncharacterized protein n=1 Tax=Brassica cretica TaxID=69181 RepID=A0A8S9JI44_BRACR|nr:hypothetical protein F2Q68_00004029 [Brassica cretica]KAF2614414.1 hypothetical protein F2Q70_00010933 [Brassica cretica]
MHVFLKDIVPAAQNNINTAFHHPRQSKTTHRGGGERNKELYSVSWGRNGDGSHTAVGRRVRRLRGRGHCEAH